MDKKRQSADGLHHMGKRSKKKTATCMDGLLVPSKSRFDLTTNQILVIGPPSNFDDTPFSDWSEHLVMGEKNRC